MFEHQFLLSQILMVVSFMLTLTSFQLKKGKWFRVLFVLSSLFAGTHFILLGTYTAAFIVYTNGLRWLISIFLKQRYILFLFIGIAILIAVVTWGSWISLLPTAGAIFGTLASFQEKEKRTRQILFCATSMWIVHNTLVLTPVGIIAESTYFVSNLIGYWRNWMRKK